MVVDLVLCFLRPFCVPNGRSPEVLSSQGLINARWQDSVVGH